MVSPALQSISFYQASVPVFVRMLKNLSTLLEKAVVHMQQQGIEPSTWVNARLAPDMFTLAHQVQSASDAAKAGAARLAGCEVPSFADNETTFAELQARIAKTLTFLASLHQEQFEHSGERPIIVKMHDRTVTFSGYDYLYRMSLPNLFFHITTAYDIMRHLGLNIGKRDFLGPFDA